MSVIRNVYAIVCDRCKGVNHTNCTQFEDAEASALSAGWSKGLFGARLCKGCADAVAARKSK